MGDAWKDPRGEVLLGVRCSVARGPAVKGPSLGRGESMPGLWSSHLTHDGLQPYDLHAVFYALVLGLWQALAAVALWLHTKYTTHWRLFCDVKPKPKGPSKSLRCLCQMFVHCLVQRCFVCFVATSTVSCQAPKTLDAAGLFEDLFQRLPWL